MRPALAAVVAVGVMLIGDVPVEGGCCSGLFYRPHTLRQRIAEAQCVTLVTPTRCFEAANGGGSFITELKVDRVLKAHADLQKQTVLQVPLQIEDDPKTRVQFLVLFDVAKDGRLESIGGVAIKSPDLVDYVGKALALDPKDKPAQFKFFFQHLENADPEIAQDAWRELELADRKDLVRAASKFSRVKLRAYLKSAKVSEARKNLYAFMLGACGIDADADLLKSMLKAVDANSSLEEGLLTGFVQLRPREGWSLICTHLQNGDTAFLHRYHALRVARYLHDERPDLVSKKETLGGICLLLPQPDIADIAIEELRKREYWPAATDILNLDTLKSHQEIPVIRRAILRYALRAQHLPAAKAFVEEKRRKDAEFVQENIELLKLENDLKP